MAEQNKGNQGSIKHTLRETLAYLKELNANQVEYYRMQQENRKALDVIRNKVEQLQFDLSKTIERMNTAMTTCVWPQHTEGNNQPNDTIIRVDTAFLDKVAANRLNKNVLRQYIRDMDDDSFAQLDERTASYFIPALTDEFRDAERRFPRESVVFLDACWAEFPAVLLSNKMDLCESLRDFIELTDWSSSQDVTITDILLLARQLYTSLIQS